MTLWAAAEWLDICNIGTFGVLVAAYWLRSATVANVSLDLSVRDSSSRVALLAKFDHLCKALSTNNGMQQVCIIVNLWPPSDESASAPHSSLSQPEPTLITCLQHLAKSLADMLEPVPMAGLVEFNFMVAGSLSPAHLLALESTWHPCGASCSQCPPWPQSMGRQFNTAAATCNARLSQNGSMSGCFIRTWSIVSQRNRAHGYACQPLSFSCQQRHSRLVTQQLIRWAFHFLGF